MMIPRSHRRGHIYVPDTMAIPFDVVSDAASENGIAPLMGPPGTVIFFDCLVIHGSAPNISPWRRRICYLSYAAAATCDLQPLRDVFTCDPVVKPLTAGGGGQALLPVPARHEAEEDRQECLSSTSATVP
jgi:ectoine hydroxylase-related dioxygenase (phytanoyl-CoA dioxygenase family)